MPPPKSIEEQEKKRYFTVEEANRMLPLVQRIVSDIVRQWQAVCDLEQRLAMVARRKPSRSSSAQVVDVYEEELAQSQREFETEQGTLLQYIEELRALDVELKGFDGLCDFLSLRDGREVYLCWKLGEPEVAHWHELRDGFAGRQILESASTASFSSGGKGT